MEDDRPTHERQTVAAMGAPPPPPLSSPLLLPPPPLPPPHHTKRTTTTTTTWMQLCLYFASPTPPFGSTSSAGIRPGARCMLPLACSRPSRPAVEGLMKAWWPQPSCLLSCAWDHAYRPTKFSLQLTNKLLIFFKSTPHTCLSESPYILDWPSTRCRCSRLCRRGDRKLHRGGQGSGDVGADARHIFGGQWRASLLQWRLRREQLPSQGAPALVLLRHADCASSLNGPP